MDYPLPSTAGIETVGVAALFAALYTILVPLYVWKTAHNPTYTFIVLIIFCLFRITGFILRAILAASDGAKENDGIVISEMIFFTLGFVGLLYSAFILILGRAASIRRVLGEDEDRSTNWILDIILSRRITDLTFTAAAGVGIAAAAYLASDGDLSERLRKVTIILYLYIVICLSIHATILIYKEKEALRLGLREPTTFWETWGGFSLCPILLLLLIRQAYLLATFSSFKDRQNNEKLWYPLFALPEFLAAYEEKRRSYGSRLWKAYNTTA